MMRDAALLLGMLLVCGWASAQTAAPVSDVTDGSYDVPPDRLLEDTTAADGVLGGASDSLATEGDSSALPTVPVDPATNPETPGLPPSSGVLQNYAATLSIADIDNILDSEETVMGIADCLEDETLCLLESQVQLRNQVLSAGSRCSECSEAQQRHVEELLAHLVEGLATRHPIHWLSIFTRVGPKLGHLLHS